MLYPENDIKLNDINWLKIKNSDVSRYRQNLFIFSKYLVSYERF